MSEVKGKKSKKNNGLIFGIAGLAVIIVAVAVVVLLNSNKTQKEPVPDKGNNGDEEVVKKDYTEQNLIDAYGMSIKQAEELVASYYHSDNFEFSTKINGSHYEVTVTDILSGTTEVYDVNPASNEYTKIG